MTICLDENRQCVVAVLIDVRASAPMHLVLQSGSGIARDFQVVDQARAVIDGKPQGRSEGEASESSGEYLL